MFVTSGHFHPSLMFNVKAWSVHNTYRGATALSITTLSIMPLSMTALSEMTFSITINKTRQSAYWHSIMAECCYTDCHYAQSHLWALNAGYHYAECHYVECRGAPANVILGWKWLVCHVASKTDLRALPKSRFFIYQKIANHVLN